MSQDGGCWWGIFVPRFTDMNNERGYFSVIVAAVIFSGCSPAPVIPMPDSAMAAKSGQELKTLQKGYGVYVPQCSRCHEPMMPSKVSEADWHIVTPSMAWNAGISEADEAAVLKYILAAKQ